MDMTKQTLVVFDSRTGNVQRFMAKTGCRCLKIVDGLVVNEPFILVTYTTGFGKIPPSTGRFLESNLQYLRGVAASGNRNWGKTFCMAADLISNAYDVPMLLKFELSGTDRDVENFMLRVREIETH